MVIPLRDMERIVSTCTYDQYLRMNHYFSLDYSTGHLVQIEVCWSKNIAADIRISK